MKLIAHFKTEFLLDCKRRLFGIHFSHGSLSQDVVFSTAICGRSVVLHNVAPEINHLYTAVFAVDIIKQSFSFDIDLPRWVQRTQIYVTQKYVEKRGLPNVLSIMSGTGPNIAVRVLSTARNVASLSLILFNFTIFQFAIINLRVL